MATSRVNHLVTELETTLDLLKTLMGELRTTESESASGQRIHELINALSDRRDLDGLPSLLLNAYTEVTAALGGIRVSREAIQSQAIDQLRATNEKLAQVSSHTEAAATRMLDGLDRTLVLIDQLSDSESDSNYSLQEAAETLRSEINELFICLQFQDITAQQLKGAVDLLVNVEERLEGVAKMFDGPHESSQALAENEEEASHYDPSASMESAASRQQLADEMVQTARVQEDNGSDPVESCAGLPQ
jgi:chemotaxis regulatin CheY-phosphate phosphatase CheZ